MTYTEPDIALVKRLLFILSEGPHTLAQINTRLRNCNKGSRKVRGLELLEQLGLATKEVIRYGHGCHSRRPVTLYRLTGDDRNGHIPEHNGHTPQLCGVLAEGTGRRD